MISSVVMTTSPRPLSRSASPRPRVVYGGGACTRVAWLQGLRHATSDCTCGSHRPTTDSSGRRPKRRTCRSRRSSCRLHVHLLPRRWPTATTSCSMRRRGTPWSAVCPGRVGATPRPQSCSSARRPSRSERRLHADRTPDGRSPARRLRLRRTGARRVAGASRLTVGATSSQGSHEPTSQPMATGSWASTRSRRWRCSAPIRPVVLDVRRRGRSLPSCSVAWPSIDKLEAKAWALGCSVTRWN